MLGNTNNPSHANLVRPELRFSLLVDVALDQPNPQKAIQNLLADPNHQSPEDQQHLLTAVFQEELQGFRSLSTEQYRARRLKVSLSLDDIVFQPEYLGKLAPEQRIVWKELLEEQLRSACQAPTWDVLDYHLMTHASTGLSALAESTRRISTPQHNLSPELPSIVSELLQRASPLLSRDARLEQVLLLVHLCDLGRILAEPTLDEQIIRLEPAIRTIYLALESAESIRSTFFAPVDDEPSLEFTSALPDNEFLQQLDSVQCERLAAWGELHATVVYTFLRGVREEHHAGHFVDILRTVSSDTNFWPDVVQALALCSRAALASYLPTLIERAIDEDEVLASLFYLLALSPSGPTQTGYRGPVLAFDPYPLVAECIFTFSKPIRQDILSHAKQMIEDSEPLLAGLEQPAMLLAKLRDAVRLHRRS